MSTERKSFILQAEWKGVETAGQLFDILKDLDRDLPLFLSSDTEGNSYRTLGSVEQTGYRAFDYEDDIEFFHEEEDDDPDDYWPCLVLY